MIESGVMNELKSPLKIMRYGVKVPKERSHFELTTNELSVENTLQTVL